MYCTQFDSPNTYPKTFSPLVSPKPTPYNRRVNEPYGIEALRDPLLLARRKRYRAVMASSYDRRGGNHDWSNYLRREGSEAVMADFQGPGCITRIWTADPQKGTLRIYIDGEKVVETPFAEFFANRPLTFGIGGEGEENYRRAKEEHLPMGFTTYQPIPFQKRCKVTIDPEDDYLYYQINAQLDPSGTERGPIPEIPDLAKPLIDMSAVPSRTVILKPGEEVVLAEQTGAGIIRGFRIPYVTVPYAASDEGRRAAKCVEENLWLIAHFDDDEQRDPSIRVPLGPYFLNFGQDPSPRSALLGSDDDGRYCFLPMPFQTRTRLCVRNEWIVSVGVDYQLLIEDLPEPNYDLLRFRATWHHETPFGPDHRDYNGLACRLLNLSGHENMELLYVHGAGHFVGCGFSYDLTNSPTDRAAGEGDEMFFIDDDPELTHYGTGLEDYTNDAWGMSGFTSPFAGDAKGEGFSDAHLYGYRLHIADPIPFVRKGRFTFEHGTGNNCSGDLRSVAYWYMDPSHARTRAEERRWEELRTGQRQPNQND